MKKINILVDADNSLADFEAGIADLARVPTWQPFDERVVRFVSQFSKTLLKSPIAREHGELAALAYWFRSARLEKLKTEQADSAGREHSSFCVGRGLVFHLAPSNVDTIFLYSCLLSLLCGNTNIIRVSRNSTPQIEELLKQLNTLLAQDEHCDIRNRLIIVTYEHDESITKTISEACFCRVIWGGDETVNRVRTIPLRPTANEIAFPDRFSLAIIKADSALKLTEEKLESLAQQFLNDLSTFGQQACSSPKLLCWAGSETEIASAQTFFWNAVEAKNAKPSRNSDLTTPISNMNRTVSAFEYVALGQARLNTESTLASMPIRVKLRPSEHTIDRSLHFGDGVVLELELSDINDLSGYLSHKDQTMSYFGFAKQELLQFASTLPPRSIDRIVPIGQALDFAHIWDGVNLLEFFTRNVTIT